MSPKNYKKNFSNKVEAQLYIEELFPPSSSNPIEASFPKRFHILVGVAKKLSQTDSEGTIIKNSDINRELKAIDRKINNLNEFINNLNDLTKRCLDAAYIKDGHIHGIEKTCLAYLEEELDKISRYCKESLLASKRERSEFKKIEFHLAQLYHGTRKDITIYADGEFASILRALHICCDIKQYRCKFDDAYIGDIKNNW